MDAPDSTEPDLPIKPIVGPEWEIEPDLPIKSIVGPEWEMEIIVETETPSHIIRDIMVTEQGKSWRERVEIVKEVE
jgi:hypothetical protein